MVLYNFYTMLSFWRRENTRNVYSLFHSFPTLSHPGNISQHPATALLQTSKKGVCACPLQLFHFQVRCRRHWSNWRTRHALGCTLHSCGRSRHSKGSTISKALLNCLALFSCQRAKIHDAKDLKTRTIWTMMPWRATHCR